MSEIDIYRDALFGNPPSPTWEPSREGSLAAFTALYQRVLAIISGVRSYATVASLPASVDDAPVGTQARVFADPTDANNTYWIRTASSGPNNGWVIDQDYIDSLTSVVQPLVDEAEAWAQSPTPPDPGDPTSKSAKTWAEEAAESAALLPVESIPEEAGFSLEVFDLDGFSAGGWDFKGAFLPAQLGAPDGSITPDALTPDALARLLPSGFSGEWFTFSTESGFSFVIEDLDGYVGFGQENSGDLYGSLAGGGGGTEPILYDVAVYGDSMSDAGVPWLSPGEDWPSVLRSLGRTVNERAVAGQSAGQIIARQGGDPCLITVSGNQIPASGSVAITAKSELFVQNFGSQAAQSITGILCGVHGTVLRDAPGNTDNYTFQRTTAGIAIPCPAASPFVPDLGSADQESTQVIWVGRNGVASIMTTTIAKVEEAIRYLDHGRFLIVGVTTLFDGSEDIGSPNYNLIVSYNNYMAARWGGRFFDVRRYMIDQALADAGITPNSTDLADIAVDRIPTRFKETGAGIIHFNALANALVGAKINAILNARGY